MLVDTGVMTLKQALAANRWLRAQLACLIAVALCLPAMVVFASAWVLLPFAVFALTGGVCWVPARRLERDLKRAHDRAAADARELRTPRAPEAGPDQCPVCGMDDLDELARDDAFMQRGARSKVVAYGRKRAHRDCAELVPYVAPAHFEPVAVEGHKVYCACKQCEPTATHLGAYYRCRFCGSYRRTQDPEAAKEKLIEHAKTCPKRPVSDFSIVTGRLRASVVDEYIRGSEVKLTNISVESGWRGFLRPTVKEWRR